MNSVRNQVKVGMMVLGVLGGTVAAQDFDRPLSQPKERVATGQPSSSQTRIFSNEGDDQYEIVISNGEISAKVNGKKVPAERIRRSKDKVEILDKNGEVQKSFDVAGTDGGPWRMAVRGVDPDAPKPRVMIGITMSETEDGVVVDHVYDGLPAEKAGLEAQDIIIAIDGQGDLDQKSFREALNKKEAGDQVKLKVRRDGKDRDITIELQKFDSEKLGAQQFMWRGENMGDMGNMAEMFKNNPEAMKRFEEAMKLMPEGQRAFVWGAGPEGDFKFAPFAGGESKRVDERHAQMEKKIAELDKKLSRINEQMERLEALISKLAEKNGDR